MKLPSFLTGNLWKIGTIGAGIIVLVLTSLLIAAQFENKSLVHQRDVLTQQINDPVTGYVAQLSQSRTNVEQLKTAIEAQKKKFQQAADESNARLKDTEAKLAVAQAQTKNMEKRLASFLATGPKGATPIERISDIDRRGLEELVQ